MKLLAFTTTALVACLPVYASPGDGRDYYGHMWGGGYATTGSAAGAAGEPAKAGAARRAVTAAIAVVVLSIIMLLSVMLYC